MRFFSLDSSFHKYGTILFDLIVMNILWYVITIGSLGFLAPMTSAALFNSINHTLISEDGYMMSSFFTVFRRKFLKGLGLCLAGFLMIGMAVFNIWTVWSGFFNAMFLLPLYIMIFAEAMITVVYASALLAETDMTLKQLIKYGFLLSNKHFLISIAMILVIVAVIYVGIFYSPIVLIAGVAPLFWYMAWLLQKKVFDKYYLDKLL